MASKHLSIRMDPKSLERLDAESRRMRLSRSEVARTLLEEGLRMEAHPGILFRPGPSGRRPGLRNGADVWEVIGCLPKGKITDAKLAYVADFMSLSQEQVRAAIDYYIEFKDDIDEWIRLNNEEAERAYAEWQRNQDSRTSTR
jgi:uncharacterized protein (DUF433 family)